MKIIVNLLHHIKFMRPKNFILYLLPVAAALLCGCKNERAEHAGVLSDWIGREIVLPDELVYRIQDDTIDVDFSCQDFKIVNYVDSSGCTSCRMKLDLWADLVNELKTLTDLDIEVITVVSTKRIGDIYSTIFRNNYLNPVVFDPGNVFDQSNSLPPRPEHHCFLLDAENRVVAIGNPVLNPKIKELYKQYIMADIEPGYDNVVNTRPAKPLGIVHSGETATRSFYINVCDSVEYTVQAVVPSCDCVEATVGAASDGGVLKVDVTFTADSVPGALRRYVDVFFNEKDAPERLVIYGFVKKLHAEIAKDANKINNGQEVD